VNCGKRTSARSVSSQCRKVSITPMASIRHRYFIRKKDFNRAGESTISLKNILKSMNFDPALIRRLAICGYEGEINVVIHGGDGTMDLEIFSDHLILEISDNGPGIADIELAMTEGFSTATDEDREMGFGAGMGLPNMRKNADEFRIDSHVGVGTKVFMLFHMQAPGKTS
jgi:serine/threonine-protein kinase RsbT